MYAENQPNPVYRDTSEPLKLANIDFMLTGVGGIITGAVEQQSTAGAIMFGSFTGLAALGTLVYGTEALQAWRHNRNL
jgi:hypothetical protein